MADLAAAINELAREIVLALAAAVRDSRGAEAAAGAAEKPRTEWPTIFASRCGVCGDRGRMRQPPERGEFVNPKGHTQKIAYQYCDVCFSSRLTAAHPHCLGCGAKAETGAPLTVVTNGEGTPRAHLCGQCVDQKYAQTSENFQRSAAVLGCCGEGEPKISMSYPIPAEGLLESVAGPERKGANLAPLSQRTSASFLERIPRRDDARACALEDCRQCMKSAPAAAGES